jgi:hypothetical protein
MSAKNTKYLLLSLSLIALVLLGALVYGTYRINGYVIKTEEMLRLADESVQADILAHALRVLQNESSQELTALEDFTLSESELVLFVENVEATGRELALETEIASIIKTEDKKGIEPTIIKLTVETTGSWSNSVTFLRAIENMPYRLIIDEASLDKEEQHWRTRVVMSVHLFKEL